jgi:hypothetical protein
MKIRIVPHSPDHRDAVDAFNLRMRAGGSHWGFYVDSKCQWIPPRAGSRVWRDFFLAVEDDGTVRGAYALKPQAWYIRGRTHTVAYWQGTFSQGAIDKRFAAMGLRLIRDMVKKQPLLYSWGHGGDNASIVQLLRKIGWHMHPTPLCVYVHHPYRFLRGNRYLRTTPERRTLMNAVAFSGAGTIGFRALHKALAAKAAFSARHLPPRNVDVEVFETFGPWADDLWERCRDGYGIIATRDADIMNTLMPRDGWPHAIRLRMRQRGETVGWAAVKDTRMCDDPRFGSLRVGSIIDCLAHPADAAAIVQGATRFLRERDVDVIISNQSHPGWLDGFARNGFMLVPNKRLFAAAPELHTLLEPMETSRNQLHLTNMDGHGPHML